VFGLHARLFSLALLLCCLSGRSLAAAELPGTKLTIERSKAAESCASEAMIVRELERRWVARANAQQPLDLKVSIDAEGSAFVARIAVGGRRQGERTLSAEGPSCEALRDVLVVSLLLLIDDDAESEAPSAPPPPKPAPSPAALWFAAGGAATHGLPLAWSSAWYGELALRWPAWDLGLAGVWAPPKVVDFSPGAVRIRTLAARLRGCYVFERAPFRAGGCLFGVLSSLRGEGQGFSNTESTQRTWLLLGLGPELRWLPGSRFSLGVSAQLLGSAQAQSFAIHGLAGEAYRTDRWVSWLGLDLAAQLW
jgi:hypothetical protein